MTAPRPPHVQVCGACPNMDPKQIPTMNGDIKPIHYCWGRMVCVTPKDRVPGCVYRARGYIPHELRDRESPV